MFAEMRRQMMLDMLKEQEAARRAAAAAPPKKDRTQAAHDASKHSRPHGQRGFGYTVPMPDVPLPAESSIPHVEMPRDIPKCKSKPRAAPKTGTIHRRTSIIPAFTKLKRAELEILAKKWNIEPHGKTMAQIQDDLFELDAFLTEQARRRQA